MDELSTVSKSINSSRASLKKTCEQTCWKSAVVDSVLKKNILPSIISSDFSKILKTANIVWEHFAMDVGVAFDSASPEAHANV